MLPAGIPADVTVVRESPSRGVSFHLLVRPPIGASVINGIKGIVRPRKLPKKGSREMSWQRKGRASTVSSTKGQRGIVTRVLSVALRAGGRFLIFVYA